MNNPTPELRGLELRGRIAVSGEPIYQVAARAGLHPSRLSAMLHERIPLPAEVTARVLAALERHAEGGPATMPVAAK